MNSFPSFNSDKFPKDGDYEDFHMAVQDFQKYTEGIKSCEQLGIITAEERQPFKKLRNLRASAAAVPVDDLDEEKVRELGKFITQGTILQRQVELFKWRISNSESFQKDTVWQTIYTKTQEKFQQQEPAKCTQWQLRKERWEQHAIFAHYTSIGIDRVHTCIKNIHELYKKATNVLARYKSHHSIVDRVDKVLTNVKPVHELYKENVQPLVQPAISQEFIEEYQRYLDQVKIWKSNTKQSLIYSMLARLELAAQEKDVTYDDLLFPLYNQVNDLLGVQEQKGFTPDTPLCTMTPELFQKFHLAIFKYQKKAERASIAKRVNALPWFHEKSVPFGIKAIIHNNKLFSLPSDASIKRFSNIYYSGPSICDLALCTIYWAKLKKLILIDKLDSPEVIQNIYKVVDQLVGFYIRQFDEVHRDFPDEIESLELEKLGLDGPQFATIEPSQLPDYEAKGYQVVSRKDSNFAKDLQLVWKKKIQSESDKIFDILSLIIEPFFKKVEISVQAAYPLSSIFNRLNELADSPLSTGNKVGVYKKRRNEAQKVFATKFEQEVLLLKIKPSVFFSVFSALVPTHLRNSVDILQRVVRDNESKVQESTIPLLEQIRDALSVIWPVNANNILGALIEYLVRTVTDPKSSMLAIIEQYDTFIQSANIKKPRCLVEWLSGQKTNIKKAQDAILQIFPLLNENSVNASSNLVHNSAENIDEAIEVLKAYARFDRGLFHIVVKHLDKYITQTSDAVLSKTCRKVVVSVDDQKLFYEFGMRCFEHHKKSSKTLLSDKYIFELLPLCPSLLQELREDIFECMHSHIEDVVQNIANFDDFSFLLDDQKKEMHVAIDKYWFDQLQKYNTIDERVLDVKLYKAKNSSSFPLTEHYKKEIFDWFNNRLSEHAREADSALAKVISNFGTDDQKQKFYALCFEHVFENVKPDEKISEILLNVDLLRYSHFVQMYGKANIPTIFQRVQTFFNRPFFNSMLYTILKNNFIIADADLVHNSENSLRDENYSMYRYLSEQFETIFNEQHKAIFDTIEYFEKEQYELAYIAATKLEVKLPPSGSTLITEADLHAKEAMRMLLKKAEEWFQNKITGNDSIDDIRISMDSFKKHFLIPFATKSHAEINEWIQPLFTLCEKVKDIRDFYEDIKKISQNSLEQEWLAPFAREDIVIIFKSLPKTAKSFLLEQLSKVEKSQRSNEVWNLLTTVLEGRSDNILSVLEVIRQLAVQHDKIAHEDRSSLNQNETSISERIWCAQLKVLFTEEQEAHNQGIQKEEPSKREIKLLRLGTRQVAEEVWGQLFNNKGQLLGEKEFNRHTVIPVTSFDTVYWYKFLPDAPGIQWMSCALRTLLWDEKKQIPFHVELARFSRGTAGQTEAYPVLISQGVKGKTLAEVWKIKPDLKLDVASFSREFLRVLIDLEQDGKPENYIAVEMDNGRYQLVNIDGEQAFASSGVLREQKIMGRITAKLLTKTVLFCFSTMNDSIDDKVANEFLGINAIEFVKKFIKEVYRYNTQLLQLFSHKQCEDWLKQKEPRFLIAPLQEDIVQSMYTIICRIQDAIKENKKITHIELLRKVHPLIASYYESALEENMHTSKRFLKVVQSEYQVIHNHEKDRETFLTNSMSTQVIESMFGFIPAARGALFSHMMGSNRAIQYLESIVGQKSLIHQAQNELVDEKDTTWKEITLPLYKEQVIHGILDVIRKDSLPQKQNFILQKIVSEAKEKKLSLRALNLSRCSVLTNDMLKQIIEVSPELRFLDISYCTQIDETILRQLPFYCPTLRTLKIDGLSITSMSNSWVWMYSSLEFKQLQYLSCNECYKLDRVALRAPQLQVIHFKNCKQLTKLSLECSNNAKAILSGCTLLQNREIGEKDITIFNTAKALQNTVEIDFYEIRRDSTHVEKLKTKLTTLKGVTNLIIKNPCTAEELEKNSDTLKSEKEFVSWLLSMYRFGLIFLDVSNCLWVDDDRLKEIIIDCPNLETLFCAHTRITDASKAAFDAGNLQLKVIDISDTVSGDTLISAILEKCPHLTKVMLRKTLVTGAGIQALKEHGKALKVIDLSECLRIEDKDIESLLENTTLESVHFTDSSETGSISFIGNVPEKEVK